MQKCRVCNEEKTLTSFPKNYTYKSGVASICKCCSAKKTAEYRSRFPYKNAANKYKIPEEQVKLLWERKLCDICGKPNKNSKQVCIDHCHDTGKVRGTLCDDCNTALGKFKDNVELLQKAIQYLKEHK